MPSKNGSSKVLFILCFIANLFRYVTWFKEKEEEVELLEKEVRQLMQKSHHFAKLQYQYNELEIQNKNVKADLEIQKNIVIQKNNEI